ncbi:hypothetical protein EYV94_18105 [Puteibacter caeruleilacunae]|nr:hypothetical protein EYV94_18105 [Puteibacter caeruleilacunae]
MKKKSLKSTNSMSSRERRARDHENKLLAVGILCIIMSIVFIAPTAFTFKSSLVQLKGKLSNVDIHIDNVTSRNRYGGETKSRRATLVFSLSVLNKRFILMENIGQKYIHEKYNKIRRHLKNADEIIVWIKESEKEDKHPKIFQIDTDGKTVLSYDEVKSEKDWEFLMLFFTGLALIVSFVWKRYPEKVMYLLKE